MFFFHFFRFRFLFFLKNLQSINRDLEKQVVALKRQLESETLLRVDLENKNKTLREELQFNQHVFETVRQLVLSVDFQVVSRLENSTNQRTTTCRNRQ